MSNFDNSDIPPIIEEITKTINYPLFVIRFPDELSVRLNNDWLCAIKFENDELIMLRNFRYINGPDLKCILNLQEPDSLEKIRRHLMDLISGRKEFREYERYRKKRNRKR